MFENLSIDDLHLKFRSIITLIPIVLQKTGVPLTEDDAIPKPNVDGIIPPLAQRVMDWLATILVVEHEIVAVAVEEPNDSSLGVLVSAHFDHPLPSPVASSPPQNSARPFNSYSSSAAPVESPPPRPAAQLEFPTMQTKYLIGSNPRFRNGHKKNGKNRRDCHGWETFCIGQSEPIVETLDVTKPCIYAFRAYTSSRQVL